MPPIKERPFTLLPSAVPSLPVDVVGAALPIHPVLPAREAVPMDHASSLHLHSSTMLATTTVPETQTNAGIPGSLPCMWGHI